MIRGRIYRLNASTKYGGTDVGWVSARGATVLNFWNEKCERKVSDSIGVTGNMSCSENILVCNGLPD